MLEFNWCIYMYISAASRVSSLMIFTIIIHVKKEKKWAFYLVIFTYNGYKMSIDLAILK